MRTGLEELIDHLCNGPDNESFDLNAFLEGLQKKNKYMDNDEAFIRLLCEISNEFRSQPKNVLK